jgi:hypothetical protein
MPILNKLRDNYRDSGKMTTYFDIKDSLKIEESLNIKIFQYRQIVCKFRISAHNLHIETDGAVFIFLNP